MKRPLLNTMTGENYMLARLHFKMSDKARLLRAFSRMRCISFDSSRQCWDWLYEHESRGLGLKVPYEKIPPERCPIILGRIYLKGEHTAYVDVNSFDRAVKGVLFFDEHLGRSLFEIEDIEVLNRLFDQQVNNAAIHTQCFDRQLSPRNKADVAENRLLMIASMEISVERKQRLLMEWSEKESKKPLPEIERLPVAFYEEGIGHMEMCLKMRETIAIQHWLGRKEYSFHDLLQGMRPSHGYQDK